MTVTERDSSRSRVAGTSRIDFTPAQTTTSDVRDSAVRSPDSSKVSEACRCTPPTPPVANTPIPARAASTAVLETVVAPLTPRTEATGRSRTPSLVSPGSPHTRSTCAAVSPACGTPSRTAIVAGTAPPARTAAATSSAAARLSGRGRPWVSSVLASATTGAPERSASSTSVESTVAAGRPGTGEEEGCTLSSWTAVRSPGPGRRPRETTVDQGEHVSSSDILERPDVREGDTGSANEVFHYVRKNKIAESAVMGT